MTFEKDICTNYQNRTEKWPKLYRKRRPKNRPQNWPESIELPPKCSRCPRIEVCDPPSLSLPALRQPVVPAAPGPRQGLRPPQPRRDLRARAHLPVLHDEVVHPLRAPPLPQRARQPRPGAQGEHQGGPRLPHLGRLALQGGGQKSRDHSAGKKAAGDLLKGRKKSRRASQPRNNTARKGNTSNLLPTGLALGTRFCVLLLFLPNSTWAGGNLAGSAQQFGSNGGKPK